MRGGVNDLPAWTMACAKTKMEIDSVIRCCDNAFDEPVSKRIAYLELLEKIHHKGIFLYAWDGKPKGYCAFYANDSEGKQAYISLIAIHPACQNMRVGTKLLRESCETMRSYGMRQCLLEVRKNNKKAIHFYKNNNFFMIKELEQSYLMMREL